MSWGKCFEAGFQRDVGATRVTRVRPFEQRFLDKAELTGALKSKVYCSYSQVDSVLISVYFWETQLHNSVENLVGYSNFTVWVASVADVNQHLVPNVELTGLRDLPDPEIDDVEVVVEVNLLFVLSFDPEIVIAWLEVPL